MDAFLYESVNDPGLRGRMRRDLGLCHHHAWQLAGFGDALGGAILFRDVLHAAIARLRSPGRPWRRRATPQEFGGQPCYFCWLAHETLEGALGELARRVDDPEVETCWQGSAMLCLSHLTMLLEHIRDSRTRERVLKLHVEKYRLLCRQMDQVVANSSYDHRQAESGSQRDSWIRAIEAIVGRSGLR
jgi:hypothetical protein